MVKKATFAVFVLGLFLILGCQERQKTPEETVTQQLKDSAVAASGYNDSYISVIFSEDDYFIARDPSGGRDIYLTAVDKDGGPIACHKGPMRMMLDRDGKAYLKCSHCGKMKPIAVKDGKVVVE
ncbi:MAG: hypothetical protein A2Y10_18235 [Planctomycetes bacterium GWF2_41_51]|nr:MAG: hypothetical protein A2Y10_18235 [Planctomycetes bacterium GWF2_41_51]HBG27951.1 hypothetical protein [Phycisphaerales bacterium]